MKCLWSRNGSCPLHPLEKWPGPPPPKGEPPSFRSLHGRGPAGSVAWISWESSVQLDRVPPRKTVPEVSGTTDGSPGVIGLDRMGDAGSVAPGLPMGARLTWRGALMIGLAALSLTGQGERFRVDPRFATPSATISTYW